MKSIFIDNFEISLTGKVFIIAELSANHNGSLENALAHIKAAKQTGADEQVSAVPTAAAERKTVRIRKTDLPPADPSSSQRMGGPRHDAGDRPRGPRPESDRSRGTGKPAPGRPLPVKR